MHRIMNCPPKLDQKSNGWGRLIFLFRKIFYNVLYSYFKINTICAKILFIVINRNEEKKIGTQRYAQRHGKYNYEIYLEIRKNGKKDNSL